MGVKYLLPDCDNCSDREKCKYYRIPMDLFKYSKWKHFLNLTDALIQSKKNPRVCSCHFTGEKRPLNLNLSNLKPTKNRQTSSCIVDELQMAYDCAPDDDVVDNSNLEEDELRTFNDFILYENEHDLDGTESYNDLSLHVADESEILCNLEDNRMFEDCYLLEESIDDRTNYDCDSCEKYRAENEHERDNVALQEKIEYRKNKILEYKIKNLELKKNVDQWQSENCQPKKDIQQHQIESDGLKESIRKREFDIKELKKLNFVMEKQLFDISYRFG